ncbi:uncharacterized protein LY89DRAFT_716439 [Mollisia scopiformis]|uniref:LPXTG-domain-containing protein n=1 Tax=Mollisia scopiformis TaxID=149040 RepID=A0A194XIK9_MOLSC|nr:uncharacterized protein LY89DRAFT_716439 [Mollisia scopiformis]KUJ19966.1 hypothetical protein LY89DRAFT_716439 [Mollisia scopiformis]
MTSYSSSFFVFCLLVCICTSSVWSLQVTPNSPCATFCLDDPTADVSDPYSSNTNGSDIACNDADYDNTAVGKKFKSCLNCLQNSTASSGSENDQGWFFYNLRYAFDTCIYAATNASDPISTPCSTDTVCAPLQSALEEGIQDASTMGDEYSYCAADNNAFVGPNLGACQTCLRENSNVFYLSNFLVALDAGCQQDPLPSNTTVGLNTTLFSTTQVSIISPISTSITPTTKHHKRLSTGAIIGIAIAGLIILLLLSAISFITIRKRRNATRLHLLRSPLDSRFGAENITAPNKGAYSSPQSSPSLQQKDNSIQMQHAPSVRNFSFSRPLHRAGEWTGAAPAPAPSSIHSSSPPGYETPVSGVPAHHAYIPPRDPDSAASYDPNSPLYISPPQPPAPPPATSPSASTASTNPSPRYIHRSSPSIRTLTSPARSPPFQFSPKPSPNLPLNSHPGGGSEEEAKRARERLYREGLGGRTLVHGREEVEVPVQETSRSPESDSGSEELWPGSY